MSDEHHCEQVRERLYSFSSDSHSKAVGRSPAVASRAGVNLTNAFPSRKLETRCG